MCGQSSGNGGAVAFLHQITVADGAFLLLVLQWRAEPKRLELPVESCLVHTEGGGGLRSVPAIPTKHGHEEAGLQLLE